MARITADGIAARSVQEYTAELQERMLQAFNLTDLNFDVETPQGQFVSVIASVLARTDQEMIDLFAAGSIRTAVGDQLEALTSVFGIYRLSSRRSVATVRFTGNGNTDIPDDTRLRNTTGDLFRTTRAGRIFPGRTTADVPVEALEVGRVPVTVGVINELVSGVPGIDSVTNLEEGVRGRDTESDDALRNRFELTRAWNSFGGLDAIRANVLRVEGVEYCVVRDNPTDAQITVGATDIAAGSILTVVEGGDDDDVAAAILRKKPTAAPTVGTTSVSARSIAGVSEIVNFTRVVHIPIAVALTIDTDATYAAATTDAIIDALVRYVEQLGPGDALDEDRAEARVLAFDGFDIDSISFTRMVGGGALPATVDITNRLTLAAANVLITIV